MSTAPLPIPQSTPVVGEPAWDIALLYPLQGGWSEEDYLSLTLSQNWLVEYTEGCVEVLPMPTIEHQLIVKFLLKSLEAYIEPKNLGVVLFAPLPLWLGPKTYREPDLIFNFAENHEKSDKPYYESADLVMEVVSEDARSRERDYQSKRTEYAKAGIAEYWIVDPQEKSVVVLRLQGPQYAEHGVFNSGDRATSLLLTGFGVDVDAVFAAAKR